MSAAFTITTLMLSQSIASSYSNFPPIQDSEIAEFLDDQEMLKIIQETNNRKEYQVACALENNKQYDKLLLHCKSWATLYPKDPYAWYCLGRAYIYCKKLTDAIYILKKLLSIYPRFVIAYIDLGATYYLIKDIENAKHTFMQAVSQFRNFTYAWYNLGMIHHDLGEKDKVVQIYDILKEIDQTIAEQYKTELMTN